MKQPLSVNIYFTYQLGPDLKPDQKNGSHYHLEVGNQDTWPLSVYMASDMHELRARLRETRQPDVKSAVLYLALEEGEEGIFDLFSAADDLDVMGEPISKEQLQSVLKLFEENYVRVEG